MRDEEIRYLGVAVRSDDYEFLFYFPYYRLQ